MGRLLLLEDDPDIADSVADILELDGHLVMSTPNGKEALLLAARQRPDLMLLDVDVEELSGLAVARAVRDFSAMPTVVLSAGGLDWQRRAFEGGAIACLSKPFETEDLRGLVSMLLQEGRSREQTDVNLLPESDLARLRTLTARELDELPFGVIEVDRAGIVVRYNAYESAAAQRLQSDTVGRPLAELAPCLQVQRFVGALEEGFRNRALDRVLRFVFPCYGALAVVSVRVYYNEQTRSVWIFVARRAPEAADRIVPLDEAAHAPSPRS